MIKLYFIFILLLFQTALFSKVLEAKQLFNKRVITVTKKSINYKKSYYGDIKYDESKIYDIALRFNGFVEKLYLTKSFSKVKKGDKLLSIYSDEVVSLLKEAKFLKKDSTINKLKNLDIPKSEYKKDGVIDIYSKYSGIVLKKEINQGSFIKKGQTLFKIADTSTLWVIAKVYQEDLKDIKLSQKAKIYIDGYKKLNSKVDFIYPELDSKGRVAKVRFVIKNRDGDIYPNMFAKVKIAFNSKDALTIPKSAVFTKGKKHYVFLDRGSEYEPKEIKARRIDTKEFEVISGLKEGDRVIDRVMFMLDSDAITNGLYEDDDDDW